MNSGEWSSTMTCMAKKEQPYQLKDYKVDEADSWDLTGDHVVDLTWG